MTSINVCEEIQCPYFRSETNGFGCQRYQGALHCHLIRPGNDVDNSGFELSTQYALYQENPNIPSLKFLKFSNEEYLKKDSGYISDVECINKNRLPIKYPSRIL